MGIEFEYCIIFKDTDLINMWDDNFEGSHLYNKCIEKQLDASWYIMHLPRTIYDLKGISCNYWNSSINKAHNILLLPSSIAKNFKYQDVILTIYIGKCEKEVADFCKINNSLLGYISIEQLNNNTLKEHWSELGEKLGLSNMISINSRLLKNNERHALPLLFLEHYFQETDDFFNKLDTEFNMPFNCFMETLNLRADVESVLDNRCTEKNRIQLFKEYREKIDLPISVLIPGTSQKESSISENEYNAIRLMTIHSAIAHDGMFLELSSCPKSIFNILNSIESACKSDGNSPNNNFIWRNLKKMGRLLCKNMTENQINILNRASSIIAFTDFPIGLAILSNTNVPISCYKPIIYRHITPIPNSVITELAGQRKLYIKDKCKILILECLDKNDRIRYYSDNYLTNELIKIGKQYSAIEIIYEEVTSIEDFNQVLSENANIDIVLISSHGTYENNIAGLCIGNEVLVYDDQINCEIPGVVLLSACHVSPRGKNVISIVDTLIRKGACVVLGTCIPVQVDRNALLMKRLILNIVFTLKKESGFKNLSELWSFVSTSNAFDDIVHSNKFLIRWIEDERNRGRDIEKEFKLRSEMKITNINIYEDILKVLCDIATDDKMKNNLNKLIKTEDYFPESLFYCIYGFPENIIFDI